MPFTTGDMETAWITLSVGQGFTEWVDLVQSATGDYFRFDITGGIPYKWNRSTGAWNNVLATWSTILTLGGMTAVTVRVL